MFGEATDYVGKPFPARNKQMATFIMHAPNNINDVGPTTCLKGILRIGLCHFLKNIFLFDKANVLLIQCTPSYGILFVNVTARLPKRSKSNSSLWRNDA